MPSEITNRFIGNTLSAEDAIFFLVKTVVVMFAGMCRVTIALVAFAVSLAPLALGAGAPMIALKDGEQVLCGGARIWTCDTRAGFSMVERAAVRNENERLMLPPDCQSHAVAARLEFDMGLKSKQGARRYQREVYLYLDGLLTKPHHIVNIFGIDASGIKLAEVLGSHQTVGVVANKDVYDYLTRYYPESRWILGHGTYEDYTLGNLQCEVLLLTDSPLDRDPDPVALLDHLPRHVPHIVLTHNPRTDGVPPLPESLRQWTQDELAALVQSRGFVVDGKGPFWIHMHHKDLPRTSYYMLGTKLVPES